ncbi:putative heavy metal-associated domain, HMA [Medicago truncatula]|uniref:Copper chaperone n=1 Tax=Medicago truncatula TaxID=3880 RepID=G7L1N2_MEDTR|nr:protein SODIUM POTASSIUM ROOT DEFECTIVE 2 [Medicago truncatula]AES81773.1 copper chaperone [Medicago truncatula]RHN48411.1 putative heavy metal-associated domain, HMA [Medicago truncatula]
MKGIEIFCASQASTAICLNTNHASSSSSSNTINHFGGRAIDRHNPIITDPKRTPARDLTVTAPSSPSPLPINPKHVHEKAKKNTTSKLSDKKKKNATKSTHDQKKKSTTTTEKVTEHIANNYSSKPVDSILRRSWVKPASDLITPPTSSRYLLGDTVSLDGVLDYEPVLGLTKVDDNKKNAQVLHEDEDKHSSKQYSSSSVPKSSSTNQVVVLRVSLHCKGCEGKVRKHLSRMQGVTSFNIDFAAKKVTVVGDVTPLSVMASISKVKTAQIWPESATAEAKKTNTI